MTTKFSTAGRDTNTARQVRVSDARIVRELYPTSGNRHQAILRIQRAGCPSARSASMILTAVGR